MKYLAQYEVIDQEQPLSELGTEASKRLIEDILQLGLVTAGPISEPALIEVDGQPWIEVSAEVRNAGQLLEFVGPRP